MKPFTIIIPAYNEEQSIESSLQEIMEKVPRDDSMNYELIVVNDGSSDATGKILRGMNHNFRLIEHTTNRGYGAALKTGLRNAKHNLIVITDADGTYPYEEIPALLNKIDQGEMVVGSRTGLDVNIPLIRKPAKWLINKLANYLTRTNIPDLNSGLRVMKKNVVENFLHILPDTFSFTTTITLAMLTNGYNVIYKPISYRKRKGKSKIRPIYDTLNFLQLIVRTVLYFDPLRIFLPFSLILFLLSLFVLLFSYFFLGKVMDVTTVVLFVSAVHMLAIGMIADLVDKRLVNRNHNNSQQ